MPIHYYISPHLDDAIFSCGGLIYQQTSRGDEVVVITVCAGEPEGEDLSPYAEQLQERWGTGASAVDVRKKEDQRACEQVGAGYVHLSLPDSIFRINDAGEAYYASDEAILGEIHPEEAELIDEIAEMLQKECGSAAPLYAPMGYGGHVDHRLTRRAVDQMGRRTYFYRDLPYAMRGGELPAGLNVLDGEQMIIPLKDDEIAKWAEAMKEYDSQISTFWASPQRIEPELRMMINLLGGIPLISVTGSLSE